MAKAVRVGVLGLRRGAALARLAREAGMQVVAVCERVDRRREETASALGAVGYRGVEAFLDVLGQEFGRVVLCRKRISIRASGSDRFFGRGAGLARCAHRLPTPSRA